MSLVETAISSMILALVVCGLVYMSNGVRGQSFNFGEVTTCDQLASGITGGVKAYDNTLMVRTWLQRASTNITSAAQVLEDPFCNAQNGRTPVCDAFSLFTQNSDYVNNTRNFQNIRGAYTWAQSVYNRFRGSGICSQPGIRLTPADLQNILPSKITFPSWIEDFQLYIRDTSVGCGVLSTSMRSSLEFKITPRYGSNSRNVGTQTCSSTIAITSPVDNVPPTLQFVGVSGVSSPFGPVLPGRCTDPRLYQDILDAGGPGTDWQTVWIDLLVNEPGSILTCRKSAAFEEDTPGQYRNCPDMPVGGNLTMTPNDHTISFNVPLNARMLMTNMPDSGLNTHWYDFRAIDVGGNNSQVSRASFRVHSPTCIDPSLYCPNAHPAIPANFLFESIAVQPYDDCFNGLCPQGTYHRCDPAAVAVTCQNQVFNDECNLPLCTGQLPQTCVGAPAPSGIPCGLPITGQCGANCGTGLAGCTPFPVAPPTPDPLCDCNAVDISTLACGAIANDSCGNATCGPGTAGCPTPTPQPFNGTWGPYQCTKTNGTKGCVTNHFVPSGYVNYRFTVWVLGERLDNDPLDSTIRVTVTVTGNTTAQWSQTGVGPQTGIFRGGHTPIFGGNHILSVVSAGTPPILNINVYVEDASAQVFWTLDAN